MRSLRISTGFIVEDVQRLAVELFQTDSIALTLLGNLKSMKVAREDLAC